VQGVSSTVEHDWGLPEGMRTSPKAGAIWGSIWLVYLVPSFVAAVGDDRTTIERIAGPALLALFVILYVATLLVGWDRTQNADAEVAVGVGRSWNGEMTREGRRLAALLIVVAIGAVLVVGEQGVATLVFLSPIAATLLPGPKARWGILAAIAAVIMGELLAARPDGAPDASDILSTAFATLMAGAITLGVRRMRTVMWELHRARADVERLATAQERVRIARDLHDVLGHSLTVISVRSQLAARLVERGDMQKAGNEIRAVEELSRSAMADVREAVAGYRTRPFAAELAAAEATLEGAGLQVEVVRSDEELPAAGEEALAFVMREGVTNVLRHSSAAHCAISVRHTASAVIVELADDGRGIGQPLHEIAGDGEPRGEGDPKRDCNGLRGLAERLAAVGGRLSAGDGPAGGFVLRAEVTR
jgi:two-component system sensor histidine kinase DesK